MIDIELALKRCFERFLDNLNISYEHSGNLLQLAHKCFLVLFRLIPQYKFKVWFSKELSYQLQNGGIPESIKTALYQIKTYLEEGKNVNVFQSKTIFKPHPYFSDHLLANWGIYHFHLSQHKSHLDEYFVERSNYLLMATFESDNCYFIKIYRHNDKYVFSRKEIIEIIEENWPFLLEHMKMESVINISYDLTDEELSILWRKVIDKENRLRMNLNVAIKGKRGCYISFPGVAIDGTPVLVSESLIQLRRLLDAHKNDKVMNADIVFVPKIWKYGIRITTSNVSSPLFIGLNFPI